MKRPALTNARAEKLARAAKLLRDSRNLFSSKDDVRLIDEASSYIEDLSAWKISKARKAS
ncbi:MAG: hypothetical protein AAGJ54_05760 [Planctomycetota bacterium]